MPDGGHPEQFFHLREHDGRRSYLFFDFLRSWSEADTNAKEAYGG